MLTNALLVVFYALIVSSRAALQCPAISDWRSSTTSVGGPLVCAKIYEDRNCSRCPLQLGLNESLSGLQVPFSIMQFENFQLTALVRPGCTLRLWSGLSFTGEERSSTDYLWHTDSDDTMSASCECIMYNPEFLACEPREQTVTIQECTFFNSSFGGICPYSPLLRPFKSESADVDQQSCTNRSTLTEQEEDALNATLASYKRSSFKSSFGQDQETFFAHVLPQQGLRVIQRMLRCDKYVLPTPEVRLEYDYAVLDTWTLSAQEDKLYYFSSANATLEEATRNCTHLGGQIALRGRSEQNDALKKIIAHSFAAYNATFWTAVVSLSGSRSYSGNRCALSWLGGAATDYAWFFWPFDALTNAAQPKVGQEVFVDCKLKLPYICEKKPLVY